MTDESKHAAADREFSVWVDPDSLPGEGRTFRLKPTEEERAAIAARLELIGLPAFEATVSAKPMRGTGTIRVTGTLRASVSQACVVTLDPVPSDLEEGFDADFGPVEEEVNLDLTLEDADPVEPFEADGIDIGELAVQHLSLSLNPYPRVSDEAADALLKGRTPDGDVVALNAPTGPFAALAKLKAKD